MIILKIITYTLFSICFLTQYVWAQTSPAGSSGSRPWLLSSSSEGRAAKRFTLQEWLENKDRRALMDMWLSLNTPSPYEFVIGANQSQYTTETSSQGNVTTKAYQSRTAEVSAYAKFVGLTAEYQNNISEGYNDVSGLFNLRLFGHTVQGSSITLHYGLRTRNDANSVYRLNQQFPAVTMQLYLMKYFGVNGNYRSYLPYSEGYFGDTSGDELNAGVFIEYGLLRITGQFFEEKQNSKLNSIETKTNRKGNKIGIQFYF